ncbi:5-(carboxyamino)imidazole ribonucleotide mutase [Prochlorococcus marinus]|uniref:5-(carboxyamino)imidazole ribonucleotide mutase n=1 Tax=Prochlorococcus marinus TaxID=1219 RepID=UPI0022B56C7C|nr:5-(carboxyamino)imidazole ribonucleotide mutase [Prochlorococcus marinus]
MSLTEANTFKQVAVVMGSDSDLQTLQPAVEILDQFGISNEVRILSAHRTPKKMLDFAQMAESNGFKVIIAGAGGAAHLPGMIASLTTLPVIGVPVKSKALSGIDSMYSILQMPSGIPVATVAIEGGLNAGLLATQILSINNTELTNKLKTYRSKLHDLVVKKDQKLKEIGAITYLEQM